MSIASARRAPRSPDLRERSGCAELDAVIERYLACDEGSVRQFSDPERATEMCTTLSEEFLGWCQTAGLDAFIAQATPDEHGYGDRSRHTDAIWHDLVVINTADGAYAVDFSAAQYGYRALPLVQHCDSVRYCADYERAAMTPVCWRRAW